MQQHHAWVTLTGKVYVDDYEIECARDSCEGDFDEEDAFHEIASEKIAHYFPQDIPIKLTDIVIDMKTHKSIHHSR